MRGQCQGPAAEAPQETESENHDHDHDYDDQDGDDDDVDDGGEDGDDDGDEDGDEDGDDVDAGDEDGDEDQRIIVTFLKLKSAGKKLRQRQLLRNTKIRTGSPLKFNLIFIFWTQRYTKNKKIRTGSPFRFNYSEENGNDQCCWASNVSNLKRRVEPGFYLMRRV